MCLGLALYGFTLNYPFVFDDRIYVLGNPLLSAPDPFFQYFDLDEFMDTYLQRMSHADLATSFVLRPIAYLTFHLNYLLGGVSPMGFRFTNILIHIANAILILEILQSIIMHRIGAAGIKLKIAIPFLTALLFLVHPLQTQSVTYITQRFTSLAALFYLLGMLLYLKSRTSTDSHCRKWCYAGSIVAMVIGLLTKESVITLPVTLIMLDTILLRIPLRKALKNIMPHGAFICLVPIQVIRIAQEMSEAGHLLNSATDIVGGIYTRSEYAITQIRVVVSYLRLLIAPWGQNFDPDYPLYDSLLEPEIVVSMLIFCMFIWAGISLLRRQERSVSTDLIAFSIFWFPVAISVSSSFIPLSDLMFEHRSYLPSIAFFTGCIAYINQLLSSNGSQYRRVAICSLLLFSFVMGIATLKRNTVYSSRISLWRDTIMKSPDKARPYLAMGNALIDKKRYDEGVQYLDKSLDLDPEYFEPYLALGSVYLQMGIPQKAIDLYEEYLDVYAPRKQILMNLALAYSETGRCLESIHYLKMALHLDSNNAGMLGMLSELEYKTGKYDEAKLHLMRAMKADQDDPDIDLSGKIQSLGELIEDQISINAAPKS